MKNQKKQVQRVNNSSSAHSKKFHKENKLSQVDKTNIQILDKIKKSGKEGTLTLYWETERVNLKTLNPYKQIGYQRVPLTQHIFHERTCHEVLAIIHNIFLDRRATYYTIS